VKQLSPEDEVRQRLEVDKPSFDELKAIALGHLDRVLQHYSYKQLANFYLHILSAEAQINQFSFLPDESKGKARLR
jgi:hypothetical protein